MKQEKTGIEIWDLDGSGFRCAVVVNGRIRYVGSAEECKLRATILAPHNDREHQDRMLIRAVR